MPKKSLSIQSSENVTHDSDECTISTHMKRKRDEFSTKFDELRELILPKNHSLNDELDGSKSNMATHNKILCLARSYIKSRDVMRKTCNHRRHHFEPHSNTSVKNHVLECHDHVMVILDANGKCILCSGHPSQILGCDNYSLIGQSFFDVIHPCQRMILSQLLGLKDIPPDDIELCDTCFDYNQSDHLNGASVCKMSPYCWKFKQFESSSGIYEKFSRGFSMTFLTRIKCQINTPSPGVQSNFCYKTIKAVAKRLLVPNDFVSKIDKSTYSTFLLLSFLPNNSLVSDPAILSNISNCISYNRDSSCTSGHDCFLFFLSLDLRIVFNDRFPSMNGRSFYTIVHPLDYLSLQNFHKNLIQMNRSTMSFCRIRVSHHETLLVHMDGQIFHKKSDSDSFAPVIFVNHLISSHITTSSLKESIKCPTKESLFPPSKSIVDLNESTNQIDECAEGDCQKTEMAIYARCPFIPPPATDQQIANLEAISSLTSLNDCVDKILSRL